MKLNFEKDPDRDPGARDGSDAIRCPERSRLQQYRPWLSWWLQRLVFDDLPMFIDYVKGSRHG